MATEKQVVRVFINIEVDILHLVDEIEETDKEVSDMYRPKFLGAGEGT